MGGRRVHEAAGQLSLGNRSRPIRPAIGLLPVSLNAIEHACLGVCFCSVRLLAGE